MDRYSVRLLVYTLLAWTIVSCLTVTRARSTRTSPRFSFLFAGDILLANELERYIQMKGAGYPFRRIKNEFLKYDFIFANLESPITERGNPAVNKPYVFRNRHSDAACLADLKLDIVSIANNHLMDYGPEGMADTISALERMNIRYAGGGADLAAARRPVQLNYGGTDIVILAYNERPPAEFIAADQAPGVAPLDINMIKEDIETYKYDDNIVIVSLHWGKEHTDEPWLYQIITARQIIDSGADAVMGHHPHWPQGIEIYRGRPIVYSLGNLINGYINKIERDNIAVVLYYCGNNLESIKVVPLAGKNRLIRFQPYVLGGKEAALLLGLMRDLSYKLNTVMEIKKGYGIIDPCGNASSVSMR